MFIGSIALFLAAILLFAGFLTSSSLVMAQQTTTTGPGITTTPLLSPPSVTTGQPTSSTTAALPLTPQEQEQLNRLQNVIAATNQNLDETEKQIGGIVYTPRWSDPVWIEPDSAAVLVAYCLPGEFAESGQEILGGGFELEVLESYEVALPQNFTAWMMVIGNEDRQNRYPAAVGVICASDANDAQTRIVSPQEQQQINNVVQQFTQVTSIDQVINIINRNNNATNQNTTAGGGGGGGTAPPPPAGGTITASLSANPPIYNGSCPATIQFSGTITDNVGNRDVHYRFIFSDGGTQDMPAIHFDQPGSQTVSTTWTLGDMNTLPSFQGWVAIEILQPVQLQSNRAEFEMYCAPTTGGAPPTGGTDTIAPSLSVPVDRLNPTIAGQYVSYEVSATDNVDGTARLDANNNLIQEDDDGGIVTISCDPDSKSILGIGDTTVQCSATDAAGNVGTASFIVAVVPTTTTPTTAPSSGGITAFLSANPATHQGPCPVGIHFTGTITDSVGNRDVSYRFIFFTEPDNTSTTPEQVIHFNQPGTTGVETGMNGGDINTLPSFQGWVVIEILQPVQLQSNRAEFQVTCTPSTGGAAQAQTLQTENTTTATDEEETTTDGGGGAATGGGTGGTTAGGTDNGDQSPPATTDEEDTTTDGGGGAGGAGGGGTGDGESPPATTTDGGGAGDTAGGTGTDVDEPQ